MEFINKGPIYLTQEQYNYLYEQGEIVAGQEYCITDYEPNDENAVHYTAETKTATEKLQARDNIGVTSIVADINQRIDDISAIGRFLSYWNCRTGLPTTNPSTMPYTYKTGDYFVVSEVASGLYTHTVSVTGVDKDDRSYDVQFSFQSEDSEAYRTITELIEALEEAGFDEHTASCPATGSCGPQEVRYVAQVGGETFLMQDNETAMVGSVTATEGTANINDTVTNDSTNYRPNGTTYTGTASTTVESQKVDVQDIYRFDGTNWALAKNSNPDLSGYVATFVQSFNDTQKSQARDNISAGTIRAIDGTPSNPVSINADTLENHAASYFATASGLGGKVDKPGDQIPAGYVYKSDGLGGGSYQAESGGGTWGSITGTITNQTDLVNNFLQSGDSAAGSAEIINADTLGGYAASHFQTALSTTQIAAINSILNGTVETWTFTLEDETTVTKKVLILP